MDSDEIEILIFRAMERFADAMIAWSNPKNAKAEIRKFAKLKREKADAAAELTSLRAQAAGILEAAKTEAERIRNEACKEIEEEKADLEHREHMLRYGERYSAKLEAARRAAPGGVISAYDEHRIRTQLAEEDAGGINIAAVIRRDVGDERSDAQGNRFAKSTLTRSLDHKRGAA
jgi:hypothetical protein